MSSDAYLVGLCDVEVGLCDAELGRPVLVTFGLMWECSRSEQVNTGAGTGLSFRPWLYAASATLNFCVAVFQACSSSISCSCWAVVPLGCDSA